MKPVLSYLATLASFGVVFTLLHLLILWLGLSDLAALLLFAAPVIAYLAYCTQQSRGAMLRSVARIYVSFAAVVLCAGALVYLIG